LALYFSMEALEASELLREGDWTPETIYDLTLRATGGDEDAASKAYCVAVHKQELRKREAGVPSM
jgi:hypothetical protein